MNKEVQKLIEVSQQVGRTTISVIDVMSQRGAIKGEEMTAIGQLRDHSSLMLQLCEQLEADQDEEDLS